MGICQSVCIASLLTPSSVASKFFTILGVEKTLHVVVGLGNFGSHNNLTQHQLRKRISHSGGVAQKLLHPKGNSQVGFKPLTLLVMG